MENGRCSRRLLRAYPPPPMSSPGRGWPLPHARHWPGPQALEPCLSLGVTTCPLAPWSQAFMLLLKEASQLWEQEQEQLTQDRGAGSPETWVLDPTFHIL